MSNDEIDPLSGAAHAHGDDAIDVAVDVIALVINLRDTVLEGRSSDPGMFQAFGSTDEVVVARRIVGKLLDAGWRPPSRATMAAAAVRSLTSSEQFRTWIDGLDDFERLQAMSYFHEHGQFPAGLGPADEARPEDPLA